MGKKPKDQHKSGFMVRLPEEYRLRLAEYKARTGCPFAETVRRALEAFLKAPGAEEPNRKAKSSN